MSGKGCINLEGGGYEVVRQITGDASLQHLDVIRHTLVEGLQESLELLLFRDTSEIAGELQGSGVYIGTGGVALALKRVLDRAAPLSAYLPEALLQRAQRCYSVLVEELRAASLRRNPTFLEGNAGRLAVLATCTRDPAYYSELLALTGPVSDLPETENEVLYGRAGFLYALLFVKDTLPPALEDRHFDAMKRIVKQIVATGTANAKRWNEWVKPKGEPHMSLMFEWHQKIYYGAVHGVCGIVHMLLQCPDSVLDAVSPTLLCTLRTSVDELSQLQLPSGNYPSSQGSTSGRLNQLCHGSTGFVLLYCLAYERFRDAAYLEKAERAATYLKGHIVVKGVGLCHGLSGNIYPLLAVYRASQDVTWLQVAVHLTMFLCHEHSRAYQYSDRPLSLYEGVAGMVALVADVLANPSNAKLPGYEI